jgi:hypothetical protein
VTLNFEVVGNKEIADTYNSQELTLTGKLEREIYGLTSTDGWITNSVSKIGTISKIIANVEDPSATLATANLRIVYDSSGIVIPINGIFVYSVDTVFANLITSIDMSTDSTSAMNVNFSILGV